MITAALLLKLHNFLLGIFHPCLGFFDELVWGFLKIPSGSSNVTSNAHNYHLSDNGQNFLYFCLNIRHALLLSDAACVNTHVCTFLSVPMDDFLVTLV